MCVYVFAQIHSHSYIVKSPDGKLVVNVACEGGKASILGGKEDIIAHFSYPFEGEGYLFLQLPKFLSASLRAGLNSIMFFACKVNYSFVCFQRIF